VNRWVGVVGPLIAFLGLMLVGWGLDDVPGFFAHPARAGAVGLGMLGGAMALVLGLDLQLFRRGRRPVGRQRWFLAGAATVFLSLVWFLPYADRRGVLTFSGADGLRYLGLALCAVADAVGLPAFRTLAKQYSAYVTLQEDHELVTTGIYGVIRHPIYLRGLLLAVGLPLVFRSWLVVLLVPLVLRAVGVRIRQEEELLAGQFGEAYEAYCRRTWRLLPYVY
jgi:protein-S-isoprenylcysteine O-methyltransferase Ste14